MGTNGKGADGTVFVYFISKEEPGNMTCEEVEVLDSVGSSYTVRVPMKGDVPIALVPEKAYLCYGGIYTILRSRNDDDARLIFAKYCRSMVSYLEKEICMYLDTAVEMLKGVDRDLRGDVR